MLELIAQRVGEALHARWPKANFYTSIELGEHDLIIVEWEDAPRTAAVRELARETAQFSTDKEPGWKFVFRHRISRGLRLQVREVILAQYPAYDYITPSGDINPDSMWRHMAPDIVMPADDLDEEIITCRDQDANAMIKLVAYALLRRAGVEDV